MYKAIQIKNSSLFLRYIFGDNDVHLTMTNPMLYTNNKYVELDIKKLEALGIEAEVKVLTLKEKDILDK
jgi:hypothetical protein